MDRGSVDDDPHLCVRHSPPLNLSKFTIANSKDNLSNLYNAQRFKQPSYTFLYLIALLFSLVAEFPPSIYNEQPTETIDTMPLFAVQATLGFIGKEPQCRIYLALEHSWTLKLAL